MSLLGEILKIFIKIDTKHLLSCVGSLLAGDRQNMIKVGTCFLVDDNIIVTNYHLYSGDSPAFVKFDNNNLYIVIKPLYTNASRDISIALIKKEKDVGKGLILNGKLPKISSEIYVYGNPLGLENTVSKGIISAIRPASSFRSDYNGNVSDQFLQFDASIDHGSSGSPILDEFGMVVGMVSFGIKGSGANINFGIPSIYIKEAFDKIEMAKCRQEVDEFFGRYKHNKQTESDKDKINIESKEITIYPDFDNRSACYYYANNITFLITAVLISDGNLSAEDIEFIDNIMNSIIKKYDRHGINKDHLNKLVELAKHFYFSGNIKDEIICRTYSLKNDSWSPLWRGNDNVTIKINVVKLFGELPKPDGQNNKFRNEMSKYIMEELQ